MHHYGEIGCLAMAWTCQSIVVVDGSFDSLSPCNVVRSWHWINAPRLTSQDELLFLFIGLTNNRYRQFHLSIDQKEYAIECNWCHIYWMGVTCLNLQQTLSWRSIFDYEQVKIWTTENETRERGWTLLSNRKKIYLTINLEHMSYECWDLKGIWY